MSFFTRCIDTFGHTALGDQERDELFDLFLNRLSPEERRSWTDLQLLPELFSDDEVRSFAAGIRWMRFTPNSTERDYGWLEFSDGPSWRGPANSAWYADFATAFTLAEEVLGLRCTLSYRDPVEWGTFDEKPLHYVMAQAHQAWARRRYPIGHPQHPDTLKD